MISLRSPWAAAEAFNAEEMIDPRDTRPILNDWLEMSYDSLPPDLGRKTRPMRP
jgi:hypothetical protein